ncbi:hypothetical protein ACHQM5_005703 [Ranunculus cassubicifolius]
MAKKRRTLGPSSVHLPHNLILEILSRLPAKTLTQFKSVCKPWRNSICSPKFIKMHLNQANQSDHVNLFLHAEPYPSMSNRFGMESHIYCVQGDDLDLCTQIDNPFDYVNEQSVVLGSCNGLVCLGRKRDICLLNPLTREYKFVKFDKEFDVSYRCVYGLGYDSVNDDYLLVQIVHPNKKGPVYNDFIIDNYFDELDEIETDVEVVPVYVYSLNSARCLKGFKVPYRISHREELGIYLNGCLHWVGRRKGSSLTIVSFHSGDRVFRELPLPVDFRSADFTVGMMGAKICILSDSYAAGTELWLMKRYGVATSWVKLFSIKKGILSSVPRSKALCFSENGKILLADENKQLLYQPKLDRLWDIKYRTISWPRLNNSVVHVPSLVSLKTGTFVEDFDEDKPPSKKRKVRARWYDDWDDWESDKYDDYEEYDDEVECSDPKLDDLVGVE